MVKCPKSDQPTTPIPPLARKRQPPPARPARVSRSRSPSGSSLSKVIAQTNTLAPRGAPWHQQLAELNPEAMIMDGFDKAIIGFGCQYSKNVVAVYSEEKIIEKLAEEMSHEDAVEYYGFNVACAWVGPNTPIIVSAVDIDFDFDDDIWVVEDKSDAV